MGGPLGPMRLWKLLVILIVVALLIYLLGRVS